MNIPRAVSASRDVRQAYRVEHSVEVLVERIGLAAQAHHPGGGDANVSVWYEPDARFWIASVSTADGKLVRSACGPTELGACQALAHALTGHDDGVIVPLERPTRH